VSPLVWQRLASDSVLRNADFLRLWSAQTVSAFGFQIGGLAIPLAAIIVLEVSAFQVALLTTMAHLPFLLFSLPVGVWVDRVRRRPILVFADIGRGVALASIPLAYLLDVLTIWQLYAVEFTIGTLTVFFDVAYQSYLPSLVTREQLQDGNSRLELSRSGAQVSGPGLAGLLVQAVTAPYAIAANALALIGSALFLSGIRREEKRVESAPAAHPGRRGARMLREIKEGLGFVLRHPYMRPSLISTAAINFFGLGFFTILLVYAVRELGMNAAQVGLAFTLGNIGLLAGALFASRATRLLGGIGRTLVLAGAAMGWGLLLIPLAPSGGAIPFLAAGMGLYMFFAITSNVVGISLYQAITPDRLLGRMNASRRFVVWGINPLGTLAGGALASTAGLRNALWITAIGASVSFLPLLLSPIRSVRTLQDAEDALGLQPREHPVVS
jgi:MFS family permease